MPRKTPNRAWVVESRLDDGSMPWSEALRSRPVSWRWLARLVAWMFGRRGIECRVRPYVPEESE